MKNIITFCLISILLVLASVHPPKVSAGISSCAISVNMSTMPTSSSKSFVITIENQDDTNPIRLVEITRPTEQVTITSASAAGWSINNSGDKVIFYGAEIQLAQSDTFEVYLSSSSSVTDPISWSAKVSDQLENPEYQPCDGDPTLEIVASTNNNTPTPTSVESSSTKSTETVLNSDTTKPILQLNPLMTQLTKNIPTIFGIAQDSGGVRRIDYKTGEKDQWISVPITIGESVSFSFVPNRISEGRTTITVRATDTAGNTTTASQSVIIDTIGPQIVLGEILKKEYVTWPEITAQARDASGVAAVSYTLDGTVWTAVDIDSNKKTTISFTIPSFTLDDGMYSFQIRAVDGAGNISLSKKQTIRINRLPPQIGLPLVTYAYQPLQVLADKTYHILPHKEIMMTVSVIGGPENVEAVVGEQIFSLTQKSGSHLYEGLIKLEKPGVYPLTITATEKDIVAKLELSPLTVVEPIKTTVSDITVTLYVLDEKSGEFTLWQAEPYQGVNPQRISRIETNDQQTDNTGFFVPKGTYYIQVSGSAYALSSAIIVDSMQPIAPDLSITQTPHIKIGERIFSWPFVQPQRINLAQPLSPETLVTNDTNGSSLSLGKQQLFSSDSLRAQHLIVLSFWHPRLSTYIEKISTLSKNDQDVYTIVFPHVSQETIDVLKKRGGYSNTMIADPDGLLLKQVSGITSPIVITSLDGKLSVQYNLW